MLDLKLMVAMHEDTRCKNGIYTALQALVLQAATPYFLTSNLPSIRMFSTSKIGLIAKLAIVAHDISRNWPRLLIFSSCVEKVISRYC